MYAEVELLGMVHSVAITRVSAASPGGRPRATPGEPTGLVGDL